MTDTAQSYGSNATRATDHQVNTQVSNVTASPGQLYWLTNLPYAGFSLYNTDQTVPITYDFNGTSVHSSLAVTFTFTTPLNNTNYTIRLAPDRSVSLALGVSSKTTTGFTINYNGSTSAGITVLVFTTGQV